MTSTDYDDYDTEQGPSGKEIHDHLIGYLEHNTGGYQPPIVRQPSVINAVCREWCKGKRARNVLARAISRSEVFRWKDPRDGTRYIGIDDPSVLREKISSYAQRRTDPRADLIGVANQRLMELENEHGTE